MNKQDKEIKIARFLSRVNKTETCWLWTWKLNSQGYGSFYISKKERGGAHRASYILFKGEIEAGMIVCHSCDNPTCVNPDHLFLGTQTVNMQDCIQKRRYKAPPKQEYCRKGLHKMEGWNILPRAIRKNEAKTRIYYGRQCRACKNESTKAYAKRKQNLNRGAV